MEHAMSENDQVHRIMRALEVASVSGFMVSFTSIQTSCLGLCNACRECAPVHRLIISRRGPPAFLAMLFSDVFHPEVRTSSRVVPPRRVLKVEIRGRRWSPASDCSYRQADQAAEPGLEEPADLSLVDVRWPVGTKEIHLPFVEEGIDRVVWPVSMEVLSFYLEFHGRTGRFVLPAEGRFNSPLNSSRFPPSLREIFMGNAFNQSIEGVTWPQGLERLSLPGFDHSLEGVRWPAGLKSLEFMHPSQILVREDYAGVACMVNFESAVFDQPLGSTLPASLETLWLSDRFQQGLKNVVWPSGLISLGFGLACYSMGFGEVSWPPCLQTLFMVSDLRDQEAPAGCMVVAMLHKEDLKSESDTTPWVAPNG